MEEGWGFHLERSRSVASDISRQFVLHLARKGTGVPAQRIYRNRRASERTGSVSKLVCRGKRLAEASRRPCDASGRCFAGGALVRSQFGFSSISDTRVNPGRSSETL